MKPDSKAERDGQQTGPAQLACWKTTAPLWANLSIRGVADFACGAPPKTPTQSFRSSMAMNSTL